MCPWQYSQTGIHLTDYDSQTCCLPYLAPAKTLKLILSRLLHWSLCQRPRAAAALAKPHGFQNITNLDPCNLDWSRSARGPELLLAYLPNQGEVLTCQMEPKLPLETLGSVMDCSISGCKAVYKNLQA